MDNDPTNSEALDQPSEPVSKENMVAACTRVEWAMTKKYTSWTAHNTFPPPVLEGVITISVALFEAAQGNTKPLRAICDLLDAP